MKPKEVNLLGHGGAGREWIWKGKKILSISSNRMYQYMLIQWHTAQQENEQTRATYTNMDKSPKPHIGLKLNGTLWGPPGHKSPSMSPISCLQKKANKKKVS